MRRLAAVLLIAVAASVAAAAPALAGCPRTSLSAVESEVMCLECGTPLAVAEDAPAAQRERAFIDSLIARCRSKGEIKAALVAQYGDRILALPRASGFGLAAYLVPALAFLAGLTLVTLLALRWRRSVAGRRRPADATAPPPTAPDAARLEADLERYRL